MLEYITLPDNLRTVIGSERREFAVKAKHAQPGKLSLFMIIFGTFWLLFISVFVVAFLGPLFVGREVHFEADGVPTVAGPGNYGPIALPAMILGMFVVVGIGMLGFGIYSLFRKGGYFVGTPTRLIHYQGGSVRSVDWEQFSGDIEVSGNELNGNITLQMRTGRMVSSKNSADRYVPDVVYITGIPSAFEVEKICRTRIKENDPTPVIFEEEQDRSGTGSPSTEIDYPDNPVTLVTENQPTLTTPYGNQEPEVNEKDSLQVF